MRNLSLKIVQIRLFLQGHRLREINNYLMVQVSSSLYISSILNNNDGDKLYKFYFKNISCSNENYTIDLS